MSNPLDDPYAREVVRAVGDLTKRVDEYERDSKQDRADFKATIEASIAQLRRDFHAALAPIQLNEIDHRKVHENDRQERTNRQMVWNLWMGGITALVMLNLILLGIVAVQIVGR